MRVYKEEDNTLKVPVYPTRKVIITKTVVAIVAIVKHEKVLPPLKVALSTVQAS